MYVYVYVCTYVRVCVCFRVHVSRSEGGSDLSEGYPTGQTREVVGDVHGPRSDETLVTRTHHPFYSSTSLPGPPTSPSLRVEKSPSVVPNTVVETKS